MLFGLMFAGFAGVWMSLAAGMGAPWFFILFGTPFLLIGLVLAFSTIIRQRWRSAGTLYVLTNRRLLELDIRKRNIRQQLELLKLEAPELIQHRDGTGTLSFKADLERRKQEITQRIQATDKLDFRQVLDEIRREGLFFVEVADIPDPENAFHLLKDQLRAARQHAGGYQAGGGYEKAVQS
jgi:hypothetical protein